MLPCTCGIDRDGYIIWDPYCPRHGKIKAEGGEEDEGDQKMDINEIQREVNNNQCYINPFKSRVYLKFLLSRVRELEKEIKEIEKYRDYRLEKKD